MGGLKKAIIGVGVLGALGAAAAFVLFSSKKQTRHLTPDVEIIDKLYKACEAADSQTARRLMKQWRERGYGMLATGRTPLHAACLVGELTLIKELVETGIVYVNATVSSQEVDNVTPLHLAAEMGHIRAVRLLLKMGANINAQFSSGQTPLMSACMSGHVDVVAELLKSGADVTLKMEGHTALHIALKQSAQSGIGDVTEELLNYSGVELDVSGDTSPNTTQPLIMAVEAGLDGLVKLLIHRGASLEICTPQGHTPLMRALVCGKHSTAQLLIDSGDNVLAKDVNGGTTVHYAVLAGFDDILAQLLQKGVDPNAICHLDEDICALHICTEKGTIQTLKLLLESGADVNPDEVPTHPIRGAITSSNVAMVQEMLAQGALINLDQKGTLLLVAILVGNEEVVAALLQSEQFDVNAGLIHEDAPTFPLHIAAERGFVSIVKVLLARGANVDAVKPNGGSALCSACQGNQLESVIALLEAGANVDLGMHDGTTPLHYAALHSSDILERLLQKGANVNVTTTSADLEGATPLHIAAEFGQLKWVRLLLQRGANPNALMLNGRTPIVHACKEGQAEIVKTLLEAGADLRLPLISPLQVAVLSKDLTVVKAVLSGSPDIHMKDEHGNTALHYAYGIKSLPIIRELEKAGADPELQNNQGDPPYKFQLQS
jgi:ankyrin repeat protein